VLTLAFSAWPTPLRHLKQRLNQYESVRADAKRALRPLVPENDGSKWPKTTLAALKDGRELSLEELQRLRSVCLNSATIFGDVNGLEFQSLTIVKYSCRSLEDRVHTAPIMIGASVSGTTTCWDTEADDRKLSCSVVSEFMSGDLHSYLLKVNNGKNRLSHYRSGS
jgi:hypothetical protein